jgi:hypothetical protein
MDNSAKYGLVKQAINPGLLKTIGKYALGGGAVVGGAPAIAGLFTNRGQYVKRDFSNRHQRRAPVTNQNGRYLGDTVVPPPTIFESYPHLWKAPFKTLGDRFNKQEPWRPPTLPTGSQPTLAPGYPGTIDTDLASILE